MYICDYLPQDFLAFIANANLVDPKGKQFDPRDPEFDRFAGWFRAHPELPRLLEEFKEKNPYSCYKNDFYNKMKEKSVIIENCLIPYSTVSYVIVYINNDDTEVEVDMVEAINTSVSEIISKPIDEHLPAEEQLILEKQKHQLILNKIAELKDAYKKFKIVCETLRWI